MEKEKNIYVRETEEDKWHWIKECPDYPKAEIECMVSNGPIPKSNLCPICSKLDLDLVDYSKQVSETNVHSGH